MVHGVSWRILAGQPCGRIGALLGWKLPSHRTSDVDFLSHTVPVGEGKSGFRKGATNLFPHFIISICFR